MSRHLNGWHPSACYYCRQPFSDGTGKYLRFVTMTMWIYTCGPCRERIQTHVRGSVSNDLPKEVSNHA